MNRNDYMELLRDYVGMYFSPEETEDVIRDYEEFFQMGVEAGKTEVEIIEGLGSPKKVAKDLADELQVTRTKQVLTDSSWWQKLEAKVKLAGLKAGRYIDEKTPVIKEKVTNILGSKEDSIFKKLLRGMFRVVSFFAKIFLYVGLTIAGLLLLLNSIGALLILGFGVAFFTVNVPLAFTILFGALVLIGFSLIGYEIIRYVYKGIRVLSKKFQTWWQYRVKGGVVNE